MRKSWFAELVSVASVVCLNAGCGTLPDGDEPRTSEPVTTSRQPLVHGWSKRYGDTSFQYASKIAVDGSDNIIITACSDGAMDFGGGPLVPTGSECMIAKLDDSGGYLWSHIMPAMVVRDVATDSAGNVNVIGSAYDPTFTLADIFIKQFDASGNLVWSTGFTSNQYAEGTAIAVDSSDNVIIAGNYWGTLTFGSDTGTSSSNEVFLAKLDSSGSPIFGRFFGTPSAVHDGGAYALAVDGNDNIIISGWYAGKMDFGGGPTAATTFPALYNGYVASFDSSGTYLWESEFGNSGTVLATDVATDSLGNVVVVGSFDGDIDIGGSTLTSAGNNDIFVAQFDDSGTHLWNHTFGDTNSDAASSVSINGSGDVFVAGDIVGAVDFGGGTLTSAGNNDAFVAQFDDSGTHIWSERYGDTDVQGVSSLKIDSNGNAVVAGLFFGSVNFGGTTLIDAGSGDVFLAQLTP
ncbi:hypothetical protein [Sorangium sp. So ce124]|uniref:hypothetical protein n=1 Tax=Sorangium sp. So ce124 TaxID=3133280 RepID=UPI003F643F3D